jgi:two-component system, LuxR family, sensor kinase FixL
MPSVLPHHAWAWSAALLALGIFAIDTFSSFQTGAVAVVYVIVIQLAAGTSRREYLVVASISCVILTVGSYAIVHGAAEPGPPLIRCIVSLSAIIGITSALALRNHAVETMLREQANLLELTHDAIFVRDMDDTISYWNRAAEQLYGWQRSEAIGRHADELLKTRFPAARGSIRKAFLKSGRWDGELIHTAKDGSHVVADSRWSLQRNKDGRPVAVLDTNTDITDRTRVREELHKTQSALAHAARVATLGELSASIAHEVNQPLAAIVTNGEAAVRWLDRAEPDLVEARDALGRVIQDGRRASEVIRRIRSLSRKGEQNKAPLNLNEVLAQSLALVQREIGTRGISLQLELAEQLALVEADRIQMQQVLMNLLMNAVQAMDHADAGQRRLTIRSFVDSDHNTRVQVEDSGVGFDAETERNLFNAFLRPRMRAWGWAFRSAVRSWRPMAAGSGQPAMTALARPSISHFQVGRHHDQGECPVIRFRFAGNGRPMHLCHRR